MPLSSIIIQQLARIGAVIPETAEGNAVKILVQDVVWPDVVFDGSISLFRDYLRSQGETRKAKFSDDDLRDLMRLVYGFRFLPANSRGRFYDGWEELFPTVDPTKLFPIACDDYYYYFLAANRKDAGDPLVYTVDHEVYDKEPWDGRFQNFSHLLSIIDITKRTE
jgi:hypothetical protein